MILTFDILFASVFSVAAGQLSTTQKVFSPTLDYDVEIPNHQKITRWHWMVFQLKVSGPIRRTNLRLFHRTFLKFLDLPITNEIRINQQPKLSSRRLIFNISVPIVVFKKEEFQWKKKFYKNAEVFLNNSHFHVINFIEMKSTILVAKELFIDKYVLWRNTAIRLTMLSLVFFFLGSTLMVILLQTICRYRARGKRRHPQVLNAFQDSCLPENDTLLKASEVGYGTPKTNSATTVDIAADLGDDLHNDLREFSTFQLKEGQKKRKSCRNGARAPPTAVVDVAMESSEDELVVYDGDHFYTEENHLPKTNEVLMTSTESLGLSRIAFVDGERPCFRIETDF